jgi:hypothetical protein
MADFLLTEVSIEGHIRIARSGRVSERKVTYHFHAPFQELEALGKGRVTKSNERLKGRRGFLNRTPPFLNIEILNPRGSPPTPDTSNIPHAPA